MARTDRNRTETHTSRTPRDREVEPTGPRIAGTIQKTIADKGFGFILGPDGTEYFFHLSNCAPGEWETYIADKNGGKGMLVEFVPTQTAKGPRALQVSR